MGATRIQLPQLSKLFSDAHLMSKNAAHSVLQEYSDTQGVCLENLKILNRALLSLSEIQPEQQIFEIVLNSVFELVPAAQYARLFFWEGERLVLKAARWADASRPVPGADSPPDAFAYQVAKQQTLLKRKDRSLNGHASGVLGFPCRMPGQTAGALLVNLSSIEATPVETLESMHILAHQAGRALDTARQFQALASQAYIDPLTGLPNRRALDQRLEEELRRSSRYQHIFTVIMIDLNDFKSINDQLGHPVGDQALQGIANCFRRMLRDTDFVARYGGDEFVVILPETTPDEAQRIAQRLREAADACSQEIMDLPEGAASISFGMATYPEQAISASGLITAADQALFRSKRSYHMAKG